MIVLTLLMRLLSYWQTWAVLIAIAILLSVAHINREAGRDEVRKEFRDQDDRATSASRDMENEVDACFDRGRVWDAVRGVCPD